MARRWTPEEDAELLAAVLRPPSRYAREEPNSLRAVAARLGRSYAAARSRRSRLLARAADTPWRETTGGRTRESLTSAVRELERRCDRLKAELRECKRVNGELRSVLRERSQRAGPAN